MGKTDATELTGPYRKLARKRAAEGNLVTLRTYGDAISAETDRASLEGAGIVAFVIEGASFNPILASSAMGAVRLQVAEGDVDEANEVLGVFSTDESEADAEAEGVVRCPRCELAYCNFERPRLRNAPPGLALLSLPITYAFAQKRWRCEKCLHVWDDRAEGPKAITRLEPGDPRPIFRLRRSRAGMGIFLGLASGTAIAVGAAVNLPLLVAALGAVVGYFVGSAMKHDVCSVPDCRAPLKPDDDVCSRCHGTLAGVVTSAGEHFSAAADARRALAKLHAADARKAAKRARTGKSKTEKTQGSKATKAARETSDDDA